MENVNVPQTIREAVFFQNVAMKLTHLERVSNHPVYPYLITGIAQVMDMCMKKNLPQQDLLEGVDVFLEMTADKFKK